MVGRRVKLNFSMCQASASRVYMVSLNLCIDSCSDLFSFRSYICGGGILFDQERLDQIILVADQSGIYLDVLVALSKGLSDNAFTVFCGNAASLPRYMKSISTPSLSQNTSASSGNGRLRPDSQLR